MNCSGLLFSDVTTISCLHVALFLILPFLFIFKSFPSSPFRMLYLPILHAIEVVYIQNIEIENRVRYIAQIEAGKTLLSQDKLITSLLPTDITDSLRYGRTDKLASYYHNVTILFCYVVDFTAQSSTFPPQDTVELCSRIYSVIDRIVEQTGAYKVENIGDTYMACAGCPTESSDHARIICQTAIAIIGAVELYAWKWPDGSLVTLKIGIHFGSVIAGVVGTKTYSYHLFGDTVNTTSRMCSNSSPGKILLSSSAYEVIISNHPAMFQFKERGEVNVKGKGIMKLYWLEGYQDGATKCKVNYIAEKNNEPSQSQFIDRLSALRHSEGTLVYVNLWILRFRLRVNEQKIYPSTIQYNTTSETYERKVHQRRENSLNSTIDTLDNDIESLGGPSRQNPIQEEEMNDTNSYDSMKSRSSHNINASVSNPKLLRLPSMDVNIQNMTCEEIQLIEKDYQVYYAIKNLSRQQNILGIIVIYLIVQGINSLITQKLIYLNIMAFLVVWFVRRLSIGWKDFYKYSQKFIVFSSIVLTIITRFIAYESEHNLLTPIIILYIVFTALFLRLRFHYVLLYLLLLFLSAPISKQQPNASLSNFYSIATLILCGIIIYSQELVSRKEFIDMYLLRKQLSKSEELLSNLLPHSVHAQQLIRGELVIENFSEVTLLYSDIKGFTPLCSKIHPIQLFSLLNEICTTFDATLNSYGLYKVDTIGDAFVVVGGMPGYHNSKNHVMNSIYYAFYMLESVRKIKIKYNVDLELRIGIHTGTCTGAVVSFNKPRYLVWGPTSNTANYMESSGQPSAVHISDQTYKFVDLQELTKLGITIHCQTDPKSQTKKSYLLTYDPTSFILPSEFLDIEEKKSESLLGIAFSKLRRISGRKTEKMSSLNIEKIRTTDKLYLPQIKSLSLLQQDSNPLTPLGISRTLSNGTLFNNSTARSYEPVQEVDQFPSDESNNFEDMNNILQFNDEDKQQHQQHLSNTKTFKPKINYEIDFFHHSSFDLNYSTPRINLPPGWT